MGLILARSPYFIERGSFDEGATLTLDIGFEEDDAIEIVKTYNLSFNDNTRLDISNLLSSEIYPDEISEIKYLCVARTTISGSINNVPQSDIVSLYYASNGYSFYEEGYNYDISDIITENAGYVGCNKVVQKLDDRPLNLTFYGAGTPDLDGTTNNYFIDISYFYEGKLKKTIELELNSFTSFDLYGTVSSYNEYYSKRVLDDDGVFENSKCLQDFYREVQIDAVDEVLISYTDSDFPNDTYFNKLTVETIQECKHTPYRIVFLNRYGFEEDLWFFKRSDKSLDVQKSSFKASRIDDYSSFSSSNLSAHNYQDYNVNGRESLSLNTGFVPESFYENFKQLMLSEKVYIYIDDVKLPINIKTSQLTEKTHVNDKLINYNIEIEFSYNVINDIV